MPQCQRYPAVRVESFHQTAAAAWTWCLSRFCSLFPLLLYALTRIARARARARVCVCVCVCVCVWVSEWVCVCVCMWFLFLFCLFFACFLSFFFFLTYISRLLRTWRAGEGEESVCLFAKGNETSPRQILRCLQAQPIGVAIRKQAQPVALAAAMASLSSRRRLTLCFSDWSWSSDDRGHASLNGVKDESHLPAKHRRRWLIVRVAHTTYL